MKIAIILNDPAIKSRLEKISESLKWELFFFHNSTEFGFIDLSGYDVIIADIALKPIDGRQILQSIKNKTSAELYLMGVGSFSNSDVSNDYIKGLINKDELEKDFVDKITYAKIKKRLQSYSESPIVTDTVLLYWANQQ